MTVVPLTRELADQARALATELSGGLPQLVVDGSNLPATATDLRDRFAASAENLFDRGDIIVRLVPGADGNPPIIHELKIPGVVMEAHRVGRPVRVDKDGNANGVTLPDRVAGLYLSMRGDWHLRRLDGVATAPILGDDGSIFDRRGYDGRSRLWCEAVPPLAVPERPTRQDARTALAKLRQRFKTFPFADAATMRDPDLGVAVIAKEEPPGLDESSMLCGLFTAVVRASIELAPGFLVSAAALSGAGVGKGLLVRGICQVAHGLPPRAFTAGSERQELEKRLAAELIGAAPSLFLDNFNAALLRSDLLASILTERPSRVRVLGKSEMVALNSTAFVAVTGNGLTVSEDLARRFIQCRLDAGTENPELRPFRGGFLKGIADERADLLSAALTIWRWGRQNAAELDKGLPLGSYEEWAEWVRDPLLSLGCADPVRRVAEAKADDPERQRLAELFSAWWRIHGGAPVTVAELADEVAKIADPQARGRQWLASYLARRKGIRLAGFILTAQREGHWSATTYALKPTEPEEHRDHRGHEPRDPPMTPMFPMHPALEPWIPPDEPY